MATLTEVAAANVPAPKFSPNAIVEIVIDKQHYIGRVVALHYYKPLRKHGNWNYKLDQIEGWWGEKHVLRCLWRGIEVEY
jgi:hypothetical protein